MMPAISSTSASERRPATRRQVAVALTVIALALIAADRIYGLVFDYAFARSSFNVAAQVERADPHTLVIGASGGKYALDPAVLGQGSYNAAQNGQSGYYVAALLNALPTGSNLSRVIYAFDPDDVASGLRGSNVKHLARFAPWSRQDPQLRGWLTRGRLIESVKLYSHIYRYRGIAAAVIRGWRKPAWDNTGYQPLTGIMPARPLPDRPSRPALRPPDDGIALLHALAAAVRRHNVQLVVLSAPMHGYDRTVRTNLAPLYEAMREAFSGLDFCDLTTVRDPRLDHIHSAHTYYFDGAHANAEGAQAFSAVIRD